MAKWFGTICGYCGGWRESSGAGPSDDGSSSLDHRRGLEAPQTPAAPAEMYSPRPHPPARDLRVAVVGPLDVELIGAVATSDPTSQVRAQHDPELGSRPLER